MGRPGGDSSTTLLIADQRRRWGRGDRVRVEQLLAERPELRTDSDALLDLIYAEVLLRREIGERPVVDEYLDRFPTLADPIRMQFEVDDAIGPTQHGSSFQSGSTEPQVPPGPPPTAPPGYEILGYLGRGGMGVVYKARQVKLDRLVALKMIRAGELADPADRARFAAEAQAVARLSHPNVIQVYEVGEHRGQPYLALEYVPGGNLADVQRDPLPPRAAAALIAVLARAIHHAHTQGIVHRDLKPANVLVLEVRDPGAGGSSTDPVLGGPNSCPFTPKLTDFGLAKRLGTDGLTRTGDFLGTPSYAPPEQADGRDVGPAADVYSLGAIFYQVLTGRPPFIGDGPLEILDQVRFADPLPPSRLRPNLPSDLETITLACLRKDPAKRYPSAAALADDLDRFLAGRTIQARPVRTTERAVKWCRRHPTTAGLLSAIVLLTAATLVTVTTLWRRESAARAGEHQQRAQAEARSAELLLANARLAWLSGDSDQARRALAEVPEDRRDADWRCLMRATAPPLMSDTIEMESIQRLAFSPDGRRLAGFTNRRKVVVWDPTTGKRVATSEAVRGLLLNMAFTHDGRLMVASYTSRAPLGKTPKGQADVFTLDPETGEVVDTWTHPILPRSLQLDSAGRLVALVTYESSDVVVLDAATGRELYRMEGFSTAGAPDLSFTPNGTLLAAQGYQQPIRVVQAATGAVIRTFTPVDPEEELYALHPDGLRFAMRLHRGQAKSTIRIRSATPDAPVGTIPRAFNILQALKFSPDGRRMVGYGSAERFVEVWDTDTGTGVLTLRGQNEQPTASAFRPDGRALAVGYLNGRLAVWEISD